MRWPWIESLLAEGAPVFLTDGRNAVAVVLSVEEYDRLCKVEATFREIREQGWALLEATAKKLEDAGVVTSPHTPS